MQEPKYHKWFKCVDCDLSLCETCIGSKVYQRFFNSNCCLDCRDRNWAKELPGILCVLETPFKRVNSKTCWLYSKLLNSPEDITEEELNYILDYELLEIKDLFK